MQNWIDLFGERPVLDKLGKETPDKHSFIKALNESNLAPEQINIEAVNAEFLILFFGAHWSP